ncbi:MAG: FecR domain-containing protein [Phycisphaeraceae bacterium]|nr:FecR domain-containing protein [Phycisphaeraceae bacterium]
MPEESRYSWAELVALFQAIHDGTATPDEADRLSTLLVMDGRARSLFAEYSQVRAGLELLHREQQRHSLLADHGTDTEANAEMIACLGELLELEASADVEIRHLDDTPLPDPHHEPSSAQHSLRTQAHATAPSVRVIVIPKLVFYGGIAALLMVCGLVLSTYLPNRPAAETPRDTAGRGVALNEDAAVAARPSPYGFVIDSVGAVWKDAPDAEAAGHALGPSDGELYKDVPYSLQQGYARVQMEDGAVIIFQSPCDFVLEGPGKIRVQNGKVVCLCETESSKGLVVNTPSARIVDLGTEFGVRVDPDKGVHARVFQGVIALTSAKPADDSGDHPSSELILKSGNTVGVDTGGRIYDVPEDEVAFVRDEEYDIHRSIGDTPYSKKLIYDRRTLVQMEGLELYYTFDGDSVPNNAVTNQAGTGSKRLAGRLVGDVRRVAGRFGEHDRAMRFGYPDQGEGWIEVDPRHEDVFDFPGSFSICLWVKTDSLPLLWRAAIVKGDRSWRVQSGGTKSTPGALQCEVGHYFDKDQYHKIHNSHPIDDDRWHSWAVVYDRHPDGSQGTYTTYVDGQVVAVHEAAHTLKDTEDPVFIGNIERGLRTSPEDVVRQFIGEIDDVCVFSRALTQEEIKTMYQMHKPE